MGYFIKWTYGLCVVVCVIKRLIFGEICQFSFYYWKRLQGSMSPLVPTMFVWCDGFAIRHLLTNNTMWIIYFNNLWKQHKAQNFNCGVRCVKVSSSNRNHKKYFPYLCSLRTNTTFNQKVLALIYCEFSARNFLKKVFQSFSSQYPALRVTYSNILYATVKGHEYTNS